MEKNVQRRKNLSKDKLSEYILSRGIEVASVIELSEASGRVAAGLFMTEG